MALPLRIGAVLAVILAVNALFVLVLLWAYGVFLPAVVAGSVVFVQHGEFGADVLRLPVSLSTALALVAAFLLAQVYYGYRRVLSGTRGGGDRDHDVSRVVRRLAATVDVPEPDVRVVDSDVPSCYTVGRVTDATIVLTTGLIERLDAGELEAVLAHELAHIANRDVTLMTITTLFVEIADRAYRGARLARRAVFDRDTVSTEGRLAVRWFLPLVALTYVFVAPLLWAFPTIANWATRTLSHAREFAADDAAARITGDPLALATALLALEAESPTPETDLRAATIRALCVAPVEPVSGDEAVSVPDPRAAPAESDRRERVAAWLAGETPATTPDSGSDTHPPVDARIRRLQAIAAELEGRP
ncbi:M48 family metalloprotease [Halobacteria archaeon AArc-dxtr1]|nr:M48 family metalloprotease [Halobacteria archaeon AArc-dxtr1]